MNAKTRLECEDYIHRFYPNWNLTYKSDEEIFAISCRLRNNPPPKERKSINHDQSYHQITISEYLGGLNV